MEERKRTHSELIRLNDNFIHIFQINYLNQYFALDGYHYRNSSISIDLMEDLLNLTKLYDLDIIIFDICFDSIIIENEDGEHIELQNINNSLIDSVKEIYAKEIRSKKIDMLI